MTAPAQYRRCPLRQGLVPRLLRHGRGLRALVVVILLLGAGTARASTAPYLEWGKQYGSSAEERVAGKVLLEGSELFVCIGSFGNAGFGGTNSGSIDAMVAVFNTADGTLKGSYIGGSTSDDYCVDIAYDATNNILFMTGFTGQTWGGTHQGGYDSVVARLSWNGSAFTVLTLTKPYVSAQYDTPSGIHYRASDNRLIYVGAVTDYGGTIGSLSSTQAYAFSWMVELDATSLSVLSQRKFETANPSNTGHLYIIASAMLDSTKEAIIGLAGHQGTVEGSEAHTPYAGVDQFDVVVLRAKTDGSAVSWSRQFGTTLDDKVRDIALDSSGNVYVAIESSGDASICSGATHIGNLDIFIKKLNGATGADMACYHSGTTGNDFFQAVTFDSAGNLIALIYTSASLVGTTAGGNDLAVLVFDSGDITASPRLAQWGTSGDEYAGHHSIVAWGTKSIYGVGTTAGNLYGTQQGGNDVAIFKVRCDGYCGAGTIPSATHCYCDPCAAGTFKAAAGTAACTPATAGNYVSGTGATSETPASTGHFVSGTSATSQTACSPGTFASSTGSTACTPAPAGHYVATSAATAATPCPTGTYNPNTGSSSSAACVPCLPGSVAPNTGTAACEVCPTGKYQNPDTGFGNPCTSCPLGAYQPDTNSTFCLSCQLGSYTDSSAQTACKECPLGTYMDVGSNRQSAAECKTCPAGSFINNALPRVCTVCPHNMFSNVSKSESCYWCPEWTYQPSGTTGATDDTSCQACALGEYTNGVGTAAVCAPCPVGRYSDQLRISQEASCKFCDDGYYANPGVTGASSNAEGCLPCPPGKIGIRSQCVDCYAGSWCPNNATTLENREACSAGHYQPYFAETTGDNCKPCSPGTSTLNTDKAAQCSHCTPGTYSNTNASIACTPCPVATYNAGYGQESCTMCPSNSDTQMEGGSSKRSCRCLEGYYGGPGKTTLGCRPCPENAYCDSKGLERPLLQRGFWLKEVLVDAGEPIVSLDAGMQGSVTHSSGKETERDLRPLSSTTEITYEVWRCIPTTACPSEEGTCADYYTGEACSSCCEDSDGDCKGRAYRSVGACVACQGSLTTGMPVTAIAAVTTVSLFASTCLLVNVFMLITCLINYKKAMRLYNMALRTRRVLASLSLNVTQLMSVLSRSIRFFQLQAVVLAVDVNWPSWMQGIGVFTSLFNLNVDEFLGTPCLTADSGTDMVAITMLQRMCLPLFLIIALLPYVVLQCGAQLASSCARGRKIGDDTHAHVPLKDAAEGTESEMSSSLSKMKPVVTEISENKEVARSPDAAVAVEIGEVLAGSEAVKPREGMEATMPAPGEKAFSPGGRLLAELKHRNHAIRNLISWMSLLYVTVHTNSLLPYGCIERTSGEYYLIAEPSIKCFDFDFSGGLSSWGVLFCVSILGIFMYSIGIPLMIFALVGMLLKKRSSNGKKKLAGNERSAYTVTSMEESGDITHTENERLASTEVKRAASLSDTRDAGPGGPGGRPDGPAEHDGTDPPALQSVNGNVPAASFSPRPDIRPSLPFHSLRHPPKPPPTNLGLLGDATFLTAVYKDNFAWWEALSMMYRSLFVLNIPLSVLGPDYQIVYLVTMSSIWLIMLMTFRPYRDPLDNHTESTIASSIFITSIYAMAQYSEFSDAILTIMGAVVFGAFTHVLSMVLFGALYELCPRFAIFADHKYSDARILFTSKVYLSVPVSESTTPAELDGAIGLTLAEREEYAAYQQYLSRYSSPCSKLAFLLFGCKGVCRKPKMEVGGAASEPDEKANSRDKNSGGDDCDDDVQKEGNPFVVPPASLTDEALPAEASSSVISSKKTQQGGGTGEGPLAKMKSKREVAASRTSAGHLVSTGGSASTTRVSATDPAPPGTDATKNVTSSVALKAPAPSSPPSSQGDARVASQQTRANLTARQPSTGQPGRQPATGQAPTMQPNVGGSAPIRPGVRPSKPATPVTAGLHSVSPRPPAPPKPRQQSN